MFRSLLDALRHLGLPLRPRTTPRRERGGRPPAVRSLSKRPPARSRVSKSTFEEAYVLNMFLRNTSYQPAATIYLALFTRMPGGDGTGATEVFQRGYLRQPITF